MVVVLFFFVSAAAFAAFINFADSIEDCGGQRNCGLKMATDLELPPSCLPKAFMCTSFYDEGREVKYLSAEMTIEVYGVPK